MTEPAGRRPLIAGNWKMNGLKREALALADALLAGAGGAGGRGELLVCPPATLLALVGERLKGSAIHLGAQDCHPKPSGAHTGDIAAPMLADLGCRFVIVGHSERRADHGESDALVKAKAEAARAARLIPILCVGETLAVRDRGDALAVVAAQLAASLPAGADGETLVVAYEPVWAIGTGRTPTTADIGAMHQALRAELKRHMGTEAERTRILYGGSVKGSNAAEILAVPGVDGALVGGASLKADEFLAIAQASR
ncbi:MAG TPA: triose-phosphate isomerase [Hypericibacter adhaerens]|jgi:triosephosphate isomerase|uniref:Triosephosphate isomerase n=1 Tax=Hypericibacter adhaerens TaxID=2602016 RepID=A0A5J6MZH2_9PROT|nr:triose-phosphate isomerase [Hypericibacter adhaerens]QEX22303.1 triosephosphate isomerase [Hypericibacter adhaerens]HWA42703.1 triose-phosphate isomerase [Hypericibacter adhaerens]